MIRFSSLGSGSGGNGLLVVCGETRVLLDCGFSLAETEQRLRRLGMAPELLTAILVTHEHTDHLGGVARLARRLDLPVYGSFGSLSHLRGELDDALLRAVETDVSFAIDALMVEPYAVPHDAREPLQYVLGDGQRRLGVLTDCGRATPHIVDMLKCCDALFLEANHDRDMLRNGPYPTLLRERVGGPFGHLSNDQAADLLAQLNHARLQHVVAAHISHKNNTAQLAQAALAQALDCPVDEVAVADQDLGLDWREVS